MRAVHRAAAIAVICFLASCGDSDKGGTGRGGSGGSSGGSMAGAGGGAGNGSGGGAGTGSAGTTGAGGGAGAGWPAVCPGCLSCVMTSCPSQLSTCQGNAACNAIYECGRTCTTPINTCVAMHLEALQIWASIQTCITTNCGTACSF